MLFPQEYAPLGVPLTFLESLLKMNCQPAVTAMVQHLLQLQTDSQEMDAHRSKQLLEHKQQLAQLQQRHTDLVAEHEQQEQRAAGLQQQVSDLQQLTSEQGQQLTALQAQVQQLLQLLSQK